MAINTTTRQTTAFTSGQTFAFAFKVYEEGDVKVIRITNSTGAEEILTITTHYTVTLNDDQNANPGGSITLVSSGSPVNLGSGFSIVITSKVTPLQQTEITNQGGFFPEVINDVLDKAAILDQQQQSILDKTIRFPLTQTVGGLEITENAANRANKTLVFDGSGDLSVSATVDGRDVSADGAKLDTIETNAKDDQTATEIRALVESANDSNVFTDADHTKLNGIEAGATGDQTAGEIKALYEGNSNTNVFSDAQVSKLNGIEAGATGDQSASEIRTLVESANNSNVFTDDDHTKLNNIEANATADQTATEIRNLIATSPLDASHLAANSVDSSELVDGSVDHVHLSLDCVDGDNVQDDSINSEHIVAGSLDNEHYAAGSITSDKLNGATVITASEQASATPNDTSFLTSAAADARFFNISSGDTIKDGDTFPDNDTTIATTAAINDRIIDLVDDVGGFVPIANETSFPTANPDAENGTGTIVSVKAASTNLTPSGTTVTIANGAGTGNTVTITGVPSVIPSGFGFLVETTTTSGNGSANPPRQYTFHRLVPKATEVTTVASNATQVQTVHNNITQVQTVHNNINDIQAVAADANDIGAVAGKATEIGLLGTSAVITDMGLLGNSGVIADMNLLATSDVITDMNMLATSDVIADMALLAVTDVISDMNDLATSANITAMSTCSTNISSIVNASSNISSVNNFGDTYQVSANDPSTDGGGNSLAEGDLYFNTSANRLKVYNGSSWVNGVEISGSGAVTTGNTFTGDNRYNDGVKALFGTGSNLEIYHSSSNSNIKNKTGNLTFMTTASGEFAARFMQNGAVELYYDSSKKLDTTTNGIAVTGRIESTNGLWIGSNQKYRLYDNSGVSRFDTYAYNIEFVNKGTDGSISPYLARMIPAGAVELYHNGNKKFETTSYGAKVTGSLIVGSGNDLQFTRSSNNTEIQNYNGTLLFGNASSNSNNVFIRGRADENSIVCIPDGSVELYYDNNKKLETKSGGINVFGHVHAPSVGSQIASGDTSTNDYLLFYHDGSNGFIQNGSGGLTIKDVSGGNIEIQATSGEKSIFCGHNAAVELYFNNNKKLETTNTGVALTGNLELGDNERIVLGDDGTSDSHIRWDASHLQIASAGQARFSCSGLSVVNLAGTETQFTTTENGAVKLYYDNARTLETFSNALHLYGNQYECNIDLKLDSGVRCGFLGFTNSGRVQINGAAGGNAYETYLEGNLNGSTKLFYDNNAKIETVTGGANVTGALGINTTSPASTIDARAASGASITARNTSTVASVAIAVGSSTNQLVSRGANTSTARDLIFMVGSTTATRLDSNGHLRPETDSTFNLGANTIRWANVYADTYYGDGSNLTGINTDLVSDTSPQLGGQLQSNGNTIKMADNDEIIFGSDSDTKIQHDNAHFYINNFKNNSYIQAPNYVIIGSTDTAGSNTETSARFLRNGASDLYYDNSKKLETLSYGVQVTGAITASNNINFGNNTAKFMSGSSNQLQMYFDGSQGNIETTSASTLCFKTGGGERWGIESGGHFKPHANNTYDIGTSSYRVRNIYTNDLNLSNEGSANDVDGTWGSYTIQEGAEDLFLINKRNGKKYKFALMEVS